MNDIERKQNMNKPVYDLQHQVQEALAEINELRGAQIDVLDTNGVITLRGTVPSVTARERAEEIVRGMDSVVTVINELDVV
jgi:osmotically-inducible protein OsmY